VIPDDQLGDHRIVVHADFVTLADPCVNPHMGVLLWLAQMPQQTDGRQEVLRWIFRINADFDGMTADGQILLPTRQWFASGHPQLPLDEILTGDHLGHRMLNLQARVHFHKVEGTVGIEQELHCPGTDIADGFGCRNRR